MELFGIEMSLEEFDYLMVAQSNGKELVVENGKVIARDRVITQEEIYQETILELKQKLIDTDYQAIKYAEGELTEEEYAPIKAQRKSWRIEINKLEEVLRDGK